MLVKAGARRPEAPNTLVVAKFNCKTSSVLDSLARKPVAASPLACGMARATYGNVNLNDIKMK
eukprot:9562789-Alexandrium_andersonii.AAC.1